MLKTFDGGDTDTHSEASISEIYVILDFFEDETEYNVFKIMNMRFLRLMT